MFTSLHSPAPGADVWAIPESGGASPVPGVATPEPDAAARRAELARAREHIFTAIDDLGGAPTTAEQWAGAEEVRRVNAWAGDALAVVLAEHDPGFEMFARLSARDRTAWRRRAAGLAGLGVNTYRQMMRFTSADCDGRHALAAGLFQLLSAYLDWTGDEAGCADELTAHLPQGTLTSFAQQPRFRRQLLADLRRHAGPEVSAFAVLAGTLFELIDELPGERIGLCYLVAQSITLASAAQRTLDPAVDPEAHRQCRTTLPTLVIGELARLSAGKDDGATVWAAANLHGPVLGFLAGVRLRAPTRAFDANDPDSDLMATAALPAGSPGGPPSDFAAACVDASAAEVVRALRRIDTLLAGVPTGAQRRAATLAWLRILLWSRLS